MAQDETGLSLTAQTVLSYLRDVEQAYEVLKREENPFIRDSMASKIVRGDLTLARNQAIDAPADEDFLMGLCDFRAGMIFRAVADGYAQLSLDKECAKSRISNAIDSCQAFILAIQSDPEPLYYYNLACNLQMLGYGYEATKIFEIAEQGGDTEIAIDARKERGRLGSVSPSASPIVEIGSDGSVTFIDKPKANTAGGVTSGCANVVGMSLLVGVLLLNFNVTWGLLLAAPYFVWGVKNMMS